MIYLVGMLCKSTPGHSFSWMCYPLRLKTICGTLDVIHDALIEIIRIKFALVLLVSDYFTFGDTATA